MSGYFSKVFRHVSKRRPDTLIRSFSSSVLRRSLGIGGGGSGWVAIGTHPMAAARAKGSQAATEAMLWGGMFQCPDQLSWWLLSRLLGCVRCRRLVSYNIWQFMGTLGFPAEGGVSVSSSYFKAIARCLSLLRSKCISATSG